MLLDLVLDYHYVLVLMWLLDQLLMLVLLVVLVLLARLDCCLKIDHVQI